MACGSYDDALLEVDTQRLANPTDLDWIDLHALVLTGAQRIDEAIGTLDMALVKQPQAWRLQRRRAFVLLSAGRWPQAEAAIRQLLDRGADAELQLGLAQCAERQGRATEARDLLLRLLREPMSGMSRSIEVAAREKLAALANSEPPVSRAAPPAASSAAADRYAKACEHARNRRFEEALPLFIEATQLAPARPSYLKDVGHCLKDLRRPAEAMVWFERCLQIEPGYSQARLALAHSAEQLGDRATAIEHYRQVLARLDSEQRDVASAMQRLQQLGAMPT
jgi:tetratricopeptide (TPR) repeat protein